jgi:hypothetical protein
MKMNDSHPSENTQTAVFRFKPVTFVFRERRLVIDQMSPLDRVTITRRSANGRYLRFAAVHCVVCARPQSPNELDRAR